MGVASSSSSGAGATPPQPRAELVSGGWRLIAVGPVAGMRLRSPSRVEYTLQQSIGRGAFGQVWRANRQIGADRGLRAESFDGEVAIKFVQLGGWFFTASPEQRSAAKAEAMVGLSLQHDALVRCFEAFEFIESPVSAYFCIVMELANKGDLTCYINGRYSLNLTLPKHPGGTVKRTNAKPELKGMPANELASMLLQCCEGLRYLHRCKIVHRDVKPQNILQFRASSDNGRTLYKLGDLGVCTAAVALSGVSAHSDRSRTLTSTANAYTATVSAAGVAGTPLFMAPEVIRLAAGKAAPEQTMYTHACDAFSLGASALALMHGAYPDDETWLILAMPAMFVLSALTVFLRAVHLRYPVHLATVVAGLMIGNPRVRMSLRTAEAILRYGVLPGIAVSWFGWLKDRLYAACGGGASGRQEPGNG